MSKKPVKKSKKSSGPLTKQVDTAHPLREDFDEQQEAFKRAPATSGNGSLNASTPAVAVEQPPTTGAPLKPLTPLAVLWPDAPAPKAQTKASPAPAAQIQSAPATAIAPAQPSPKPFVQSRSPDKSATQAPAATTPKLVKITFALVKAGAKRVSVCGEFNGWSPNQTPMQRHDDGHWETTIALAPGQYQYKFLIDGAWLLDPSAQKSVPNQYGSFNSVVEVRG